MDEAGLQAIRGRLDAVRKSCPDWGADYGGPIGHRDGVIWMDRRRGRYLSECTRIGDSGTTLERIANLPQDVSDLLDEVERALAKKLREPSA